MSLTGVLDLVVYTPEGALALLDVKTALSAHTLTFARRADQLTAYQLLLDTHAARLGLPKVEWLGFLDLLKRKRSPSIAPPLLVPRRTAAELDELVQKAHRLAEDNGSSGPARRGLPNPSGCGTDDPSSRPE
jgi:hypothetical protein